MSFLDLFKKKPDQEPPPIQKNEDKIYNPLKGYVGGFIDIKTFDEEGSYEIVDLEQYSRVISDETFIFTDYIVKDGDSLRVVRVFKNEDEENILYLHKMYSGEFDEDVLDAAKCKEFYKGIDSEKRITYFALVGGKNGYFARILSAKSMRTRQLTYWDFTRKPDPDLGEIGSDDIFLFVEVEEGSGFITMWEGPMISKSAVTVINTTK